MGQESRYRGRRGRGKKRGEGEVKRIKMQFVYLTTFHDECVHYVSQMCTNNKTDKTLISVFKRKTKTSSKVQYEK